ncbi:MAG: cytochrome b/b6 domain-containing protein [Candidatus Aquicultor sp.]|nr:cytochrome b/b6 domain-containing protein [Candidatus Aquicultor sp.]
MNESLPIIQINLALDVIGPALIVFVIIGMYVGHFTGNVMTGRARKRFKLWQWPEHVELPSLVRRSMHLMLVGSMIMLIVSGMYIRFPFELPFGNRTTIKYVHYVAAFAVTAIIFIRIGYAFLHKSKDYREFALTKKDMMAFVPTLKYYAFMAKSKPHVATYNPMQKASYGLMVPTLIFIQIATGLALLFSPQLLGWLASSVGGLALARVYVRIVHYFVTWVVGAFMCAHIYLAITEDLPALLFFFFGIKPHDLEERRNKSGEGDRAENTNTEAAHDAHHEG